MGRGGKGGSSHGRVNLLGARACGGAGVWRAAGDSWWLILNKPIFKTSQESTGTQRPGHRASQKPPRSQKGANCRITRPSEQAAEATLQLQNAPRNANTPRPLVLRHNPFLRA